MDEGLTSRTTPQRKRTRSEIAASFVCFTDALPFLLLVVNAAATALLLGSFVLPSAATFLSAVLKTRMQKKTQHARGRKNPRCWGFGFSSVGRSVVRSAPRPGPGGWMSPCPRPLAPAATAAAAAAAAAVTVLPTNALPKTNPLDIQGTRGRPLRRRRVPFQETQHSCLFPLSPSVPKICVCGHTPSHARFGLSSKCVCARACVRPAGRTGALCRRPPVPRRLTNESCCCCCCCCCHLSSLGPLHLYFFWSRIGFPLSLAFP